MRTGFKVYGPKGKLIGFWPADHVNVGSSGELWLLDCEGNPFVVFADMAWSRVENCCEEEDGL